MQFTSRLLLFMLFALGLPIVGYMADKSVKTLPPSGKVDYSKASIQELLELAQPKEVKESNDGVVRSSEASTTVSPSDAEVIEAMGASISIELGKFGFSDAEVEHFIKGFRHGLKGALDPDKLRKMDLRIQAFIRPRMEASQARERERDKARMADLRLPMDMEIATSGGEKTTLGKLVKGKNGVLLDFWASWCGPCMALMPTLQKKAKRYGSRGIVVAGMNTENAAKAEGVRKQRGINFTWLVEPRGRPLSQMLKINSIPRMVLLNAEGSVLFNGHPMDDELTAALAKLSGN